MCGIKIAEEKFQILVFPIVFSNLVSNKKSISNCNTYVVKVDLFNGDNIQIARCCRHTRNKYGGQKGGSSFNLAAM